MGNEEMMQYPDGATPLDLDEIEGSKDRRIEGSKD